MEDGIEAKLGSIQIFGNGSQVGREQKIEAGKP